MKVAAQSELDTTLIYRASDEASHPFRGEIETVMGQGGAAVHWMYSDNKVSLRYLEKLFFIVIFQEDSAKYNSENLDRLITDKSSKVYICGPPGFITDSVRLLEEIGVPSENVLYEYFGPE